MELVDEAQRAVAQRAALGLVEAGEVAARHLDAAGGGLVEPAEQVQQRALAAARRADDGHLLAAADLEVDRRQDGHVQLALNEGLGEPAGAQHRLHHSYLSASAGCVRDARQAG